MKYIYKTTVVDCRERTVVTASYKGDDAEDVKVERKSTGWWLTVENDLGGDLTYPLGPDRPEPMFKIGQTISITLSAIHD